MRLGQKRERRKKDIFLDKEGKKKERKKEEKEKVARDVVLSQKSCDVFRGGCIRVVKSFLPSNHCRSR